MTRTATKQTEGERGIVGERQPVDEDIQDALDWAR